MLSAIGDAKTLSHWNDGVLEIREARNQFQVFGDFLWMGENIIRDEQHFARELGHQDLHVLGKFPAIGVEKYQIEGPWELAGNLCGVSCEQLHTVEQLRAPQILARQGVLVWIAIDADDPATGRRERPRQPNGAISV